MDLIRTRNQQAVYVFAGLVLVLASACTSASTSATAPSGNKCQVNAVASPTQFGANGGSGSLSVTAERDCGWTVSSQAGWVSVGGSQSGYGDASLSYTVAGNPAAIPRAADLVVDTVRVSLSQAAAACTFSLSRSGDGVSADGGAVSFDLATLTGCSWTASSDATWLTITSGASGTASATVRVQVAANSGPARTGAIHVAGKAYTVTQDAAPTQPGPTPTPSPSPLPSPSPTPSPSPSPTPAPISLSGTISSLSGSCPAVHFSVSGRTVYTDNSTSYSRGKCSDLSNGDTVSVSGTLQSDASVLADQIEINKNAK